MPTNDERREVAARLREIDEDVWSRFSVEANDIRKAIGLSFFQRDSTVQRLADLIEPEPERTCRNVTDDPKANYFKCDACDCEITDYEDYKVWISGTWNYCPNCGAKVVEQ